MCRQGFNPKIGFFDSVIRLKSINRQTQEIFAYGGTRSHFSFTRHVAGSEQHPEWLLSP